MNHLFSPENIPGNTFSIASIVSSSLSSTPTTGKDLSIFSLAVFRAQRDRWSMQERAWPQKYGWKYRIDVVFTISQQIYSLCFVQSHMILSERSYAWIRNIRLKREVHLVINELFSTPLTVSFIARIFSVFGKTIEWSTPLLTTIVLMSLYQLFGVQVNLPSSTQSLIFSRR